ncbi:Major facilitator protein [Zostera marina]|uniref:Major facilitator protein n=1 Tax=Zostera marina TaxID=29655 RepID=A0A0K9P0Q5_ZOSMR|nr:Major facilitator protein [Zostera marina]
MGVVVESEVWEPQPFFYLLLFFFSSSSILLFPYFSSSARTKHHASSSSIDFGSSATFPRFQRSFLVLYSLASLISGLGSVFGDSEYQHYGASREQIVMCLAAGVAVSLLVGTFLGMISDITGPRKACMVFCILHLIVGFLKSVTKHPSVLLTSICLSLASSLMSFSFETWMVSEHEKGYRKDLLTDTFWLMTFSESSSLIGSQVLANFMVKDTNKGFFTPSTPAALLALLSIIYISKEWTGYKHSFSIHKYRESFYDQVLGDKKVWILALAQGFLHFSIYMFWILWAPTTVADGREVQLSLLYPCFLGSKMLGSTAIPWFFSGASPFRNDDSLTAAFVIAGLCLSVVAYDYQDVGVLLLLFCIFCACTGFIIPSLARLRTLYVPNEMRGGMISLSLAPSHIAILFFLLQGGYYRNISNSTIMAMAAIGLFSAAGCIHALKRWKKQTPENWHKL